MRFQRQFASSLKETFITHLKLRGLWKEYKLKESDISIAFNPPTYFHAAREAQIHELKVKAFSDLIQTEAVSKSYALKKYMGWTDEEIKINREWMKKDAGFVFEVQQITNSGPNWREGIQAGGEGGGTAPAPAGGGEAPPVFGGGLPTGGEVPAAAGAEAPAGGEAPAPEQAGSAPSALPGA